MHNSTIACSKVDVESLIAKYVENRDSLKEQLLKVNKKLRHLKLLLRNKSDFHPVQKVDVPLQLIIDGQTRSNKLKWKKEVLQLLVQIETPVTCKIALRKLLLNNRCINEKEKFVLTNICSALHSLSNSSKLLRCKNPYGRGFVYGLPSFFDTNIKLKPKYDLRLRRELGLKIPETAILT
jgi:hypothetical protein